MKSSQFFLCSSLLSLTGTALAQAGVSPEALPARDETQPSSLSVSSPTPTPTPVAGDGVAPSLPSGSQLSAARVAYEGGTIVAQGNSGQPVVFTSGLGRLQAQEVRLDTIGRTLEASGDISLEREVEVDRRVLRDDSLERLKKRERRVETAFGQNLHFDFKTGQGSLDNGRLRVASLDLRADQLVINGQKYTARKVVIRPGGLSDAELKIYGTPPLSIGANEVSVKRDPRTSRISVAARGAGLYFKKTRILPLPSALLRYGSGNNDQRFRITPRVGFNSSDGILVAAKTGFPLARDPRQLSLNADLGLSQRVGFRGGATLASQQTWGDLLLSAQRLDVVTTQLTNKIELDRKPEFSFRSPAFATFSLGRNARAGFSIDAGYGRFTEHLTDDQNLFAPVSSSRSQARIVFSTRLDPRPGAFLRAFAQTARYSLNSAHYDATGVEVGYAGSIASRVSGEVSLRLTETSGQTPFRFDLIEIPRELRTTFDVEVTPRYVLPFDVRYDIDQSKVRDFTFGVLRSYKVFAYGLVYQTARKDLRLELRSGF